MNNQMKALMSRHVTLERKLNELLMKPVPDSLQVTRMKMEKLRIRDEMEKLRRHENTRKQAQQSGTNRAVSVEITAKQSLADEQPISASAALAAAAASALSVFRTAALMSSA